MVPEAGLSGRIAARTAVLRVAVEGALPAVGGSMLDATVTWRMSTDPDAIRERAWVERRGEGKTEPGPMWVAEDPVTDCAGTGEIEAEAVGNLLAVVAEYEARGSEQPLLKTPGLVVDRSAAPGTSSSSVVDRVLSLF